MHVAFIERIDPQQRINKDQMGGYGIGFSVGTTARSRMIERHKRLRNVPVLTLGYVASFFHAAGHTIEVISDGRISQQADLVLLYSSIVESAREVAYLKHVKQRSRAATGVIGPFAGHVPQVYADVADCVVCGEPEALMQQIAAGQPLPRGVVQSPVIQDMNTFPYPDWTPFPLETYSYYPLVLERPFVTVQASRGCDFLCSYCPYAAYYGKVRQRTVDNVLGELAHLVKTYGVRGIMFRDPLFTIHRPWVVQLMEGILQRGLTIRFGCETRMDLLDEELLDLMYRAGLRAVNCGVESVDKDVLKSADRNMSFHKLEQEVRHCEARGIKVAAFYVFGLMADTEATIRRTLDYAKHLNTFVAQFHINTPFPGTKVYEEVKDTITDHDWSHYDSFTPVFRHPQLSNDQLIHLRQEAFTSYYFRLTYVLKHGGQLLDSLAHSLVMSRDRRRQAVRAVDHPANRSSPAP